jgi:hypothetical protein
VYQGITSDWQGGSNSGDYIYSFEMGGNEFVSKIDFKYTTDRMQSIMLSTSLGRSSPWICNNGGGTTTSSVIGPSVGSWSRMQDAQWYNTRVTWLLGPPIAISYENFAFGTMSGQLQPRGLQTLELINLSSEPQSMTTEYSYATSSTISTTIEDSWTTGTSVSYSFSVEGFGMSSGVEVSASFETTSTTSNTNEQTQESSTTASTTFVVPPNTRASGQVLVQVGTDMYIPFTATKYAIAYASDNTRTKVDRGTVRGNILLDLVADASVTWDAFTSP